MLQSDFCEYSNAYTVARGTINVTDSNNNGYDKKKLAAFQKLVTCLLIMQKTSILECLFTI